MHKRVATWAMGASGAYLWVISIHFGLVTVSSYTSSVNKTAGEFPKFQVSRVSSLPPWNHHGPRGAWDLSGRICGTRMFDGSHGGRDANPGRLDRISHGNSITVLNHPYDPYGLQLLRRVGVKPPVKRGTKWGPHFVPHTCHDVIYVSHMQGLTVRV